MRRCTANYLIIESSATAMIVIKGLRQGLLIVFSGAGDEPWLTRLRELENKLTANPGFFKGGAVAFDVKHMALTDDDLQRSIALLEQYDVTLWAVVAQDVATQQRARVRGLSDSLTQLEARGGEPDQAPPPAPSEANGRPASAPGSLATSEPQAAEVQSPQPKAAAQTAQTAQDEQAEGTDGLLVRRRVRSGQVLRHPGHIVVIGDVNPGAQLLAGGDIIVWGKLQGSVHAGALGDDRAVICALDMSPSLVKIADAALALRPDERRKRNRQGKAETAQLDDQQIIFTPWP